VPFVHQITCGSSSAAKSPIDDLDQIQHEFNEIAARRTDQHLRIFRLCVVWNFVVIVKSDD